MLALSQELVTLSLDLKSFVHKYLITRSLEGVLARRSMQTCALVTVSRNYVTYAQGHVFAQPFNLAPSLARCFATQWRGRDAGINEPRGAEITTRRCADGGSECHPELPSVQIMAQSPFL